MPLISSQSGWEMGDEEHLSYRSSEFQSAPTCLTDTLPFSALLPVNLPTKELKEGPGICTFQLRASMASSEDVAKFPAVIAEADACSLSPVLKARIEDVLTSQPAPFPLPFVVEQSTLDLFARGVYEGSLQANLSELEQLFSLAHFLEMQWLTECCTTAACGHFNRIQPTADEFWQLFNHQKDPEIQARLITDDLPRWCHDKHSLMEDLGESNLHPEEQCLRNLLSRSPQAAHMLAQLPIFKRIMGLERYVQDRTETGTEDDLDKIMKEANQVKKTGGVEKSSIRQHCSLHHEPASLNRNGGFSSRYVLNKFLRALSEEAATEAAQILD